jgi:hypothetical protein
VPAQEKIGAVHAALKPLYAPTLVLLTLLLVKQTSWIWDSLYFQRHLASELNVALGFLTGLIVAGIALLRIFFGQEATTKLIHFGIVMLLTLIGLLYLQRFELLPSPLSALHKMLAVLFALSVGFLALRIRFEMWRRIYPAAIVAGLIFIFSPWVLAVTAATTVYWPSPSHQPPTVATPQIPAQNTIVLLLDELSASAAGPVVEQLKEAGLSVAVSDINPAGKNTINVIPAIWLRTSFDQATVCGPTQICSATKVLDFSKIQATSNSIDIVGFYHPYCAIQGLRSCFYEPFAITQSAGTELACSFPVLNKLAFLGCVDESSSARNSMLALRDNMQQALMAAPFWEKGGVLYGHLLVPHPLMGIPLKTLSEEYADNIKNGASTVRLIAEKAKLVFGDNFKIVVFSDHPLRPEIWCEDVTYASLECTPDPSQISTQVPLIVATPRAGSASLVIENNQTVFDVLFSLG